LWQVSQGALVVMWFDGLPVAATPLWQVAQLPTRPAWLGFVEALGVLDGVWAPGDFDGLILGGGAGVVAVVLVVVVAVAVGDRGRVIGNMPPLNVTVLK
jgi:hypothetical protein